MDYSKMQSGGSGNQSRLPPLYSEDTSHAAPSSSAASGMYSLDLGTSLADREGPSASIGPVPKARKNTLPEDLQEMSTFNEKLSLASREISLALDHVSFFLHTLIRDAHELYKLFGNGGPELEDALRQLLKGAGMTSIGSASLDDMVDVLTKLVKSPDVTNTLRRIIDGAIVSQELLDGLRDNPLTRRFSVFSNMIGFVSGFVSIKNTFDYCCTQYKNLSMEDKLAQSYLEASKKWAGPYWGTFNSRRPPKVFTPEQASDWHYAKRDYQLCKENVNYVQTLISGARMALYSYVAVKLTSDCVGISTAAVSFVPSLSDNLYVALADLTSWTAGNVSDLVLKGVMLEWGYETLSNQGKGKYAWDMACKYAHMGDPPLTLYTAEDIDKDIPAHPSGHGYMAALDLSPLQLAQLQNPSVPNLPPKELSQKERDQAAQELRRERLRKWRSRPAQYPAPPSFPEQGSYLDSLSLSPAQLMEQQRSAGPRLNAIPPRPQRGPKAPKKDAPKEKAKAEPKHAAPPKPRKSTGKNTSKSRSRPRRSTPARSHASLGFPAQQGGYLNSVMLSPAQLMEQQRSAAPRPKAPRR